MGGPGRRGGRRGRGRLDRSDLLGGFSDTLLLLLAFARALARVVSIGVKGRVCGTGTMIFALHILEREQGATLREGNPWHEGDKVGGGLVLLGGPLRQWITISVSSRGEPRSTSPSERVLTF